MEKETLTGRERREYIRLSRELKVHFKIDGQSTEKIYDAVSRNISQGGTCIEMNGDFEELFRKIKEIKPVVYINIELTDLYNPAELKNKPEWIKSRMFWMKRPFLKPKFLQLGLQFENIEKPTQERIHNYIVHEFVENYGKEAE